MHLTAFIYSDDYLKYYFGHSHPFQPIREKLTFELLKKLGIFNSKVKHFKPRKAREIEILSIHSKEYLKFVKEKSREGRGYLDYGDTPATTTIYEGALWAVGGSLKAAELIVENKALHAFNPAGGLHHAKPNEAAGFCVFNDIGIVVRYLQKKGFKKIAIVDIDAHHGDGTQLIFYKEPILKISFHRGYGFYPGTGNLDEIGEGEGKGYSINLPLPPRTSDSAYLYAFNEIVVPSIKKYKPEIIINQFGVDAHYEDPLADLNLTTSCYQKIASILHSLSHKFCQGKYLVLGGGGYAPQNVTRIWSIMFVTISEAEPKNVKLYEKLFDKKKIEESKKVFEIVRKNVEKLKELIPLV